MEIIPGIGLIKPAELSEIINRNMIKLSVTYAKQYQDNPKNFISCFIKYHSIKTACAFIVSAYKYIGAYQECLSTGKDFSEYSNKFNIDEKWKRVLSEILIIIFALLNTAPIANEK